MLPDKISPVLPSIETSSPSLMIWSPTVIIFFLASISSAPQPTTQHFPHPRATTAACDVMPPVDVKIASAAHIPLTSSGDVSLRVRITFLPFPAHTTASSAVKTMTPVAAPGPAGMPLAIVRPSPIAFNFSLGSKIGKSS